MDKTPFNDPRGIVFTPPEDWIRQAPRNAAQAVRYTNLTRSMQLLIAGVPAYTCDTFQSEIQATGRLKSSSTVRLAEQQFKKLIAFEDVPKYKIRLTTVQYCLNSSIGAIVFGATEEESMYSRWERVFEGTAASIRIR